LFGFETDETIHVAEKVVRRTHELLGILYGEHKVKVGPRVDILGVGYDLPALKIGITAKRQEALCEEITSILQNDTLSPGQAGKLKGKLTFVTHHMWGKTGRASMPALSRRQYANKQELNAQKVHLKPNKQNQRKGPQCNRLNTELKHSLHSWLWHLQHGKRRDLCAYGDGRNDIVIFTDGWVANTHTNEKGIPGVAGRIGAVMFHKSLPKPLLRNGYP
jgi:hypothetical protein